MKTLNGRGKVKILWLMLLIPLIVGMFLGRSESQPVFKPAYSHTVGNTSSSTAITVASAVANCFLDCDILLTNSDSTPKNFIVLSGGQTVINNTFAPNGGGVITPFHLYANAQNEPIVVINASSAANMEYSVQYWTRPTN